MSDLLEPYKSIRRLMDAAPEMNAKLVRPERRTLELQIGGVTQRTLRGPAVGIKNIQDIMPYLNEICDVAVPLSGVETICFMRFFIKEMKLPMVQAENWHKWAAIHGNAAMGPGPHHITSAATTDEMYEEFKSIRSTSDAVAFKLRWL